MADDFSELAPHLVSPCPRCQQPVRTGRSKTTGSLIIHCPRCKTYFPDAVNEKHLLDLNTVAGWNLFAMLQAKLEQGIALTPSDLAAAMAKVSQFAKPVGRLK